MDRKIITVIGIVIAVAFAGLYISIWNSSSSLIGVQADSVNQLYRAEVAFDISLFDDKLVSGNSVINLKEHINRIGYTHSLDIDIEPSSVEPDKTYRSTLEYNENGLIERIVLEEVS